MKPAGKVLIVDDNQELLIALKLFLSPYFKRIQTEKNPNLIPDLIRREAYDVVLLDMNFNAGVHSGNEGLFWMKKILEYDPSATIVFITAYGDVELAVKAIKEGAADFIQKSWEESKILSTILAAYKLRLSKLEINNLKNKQRHLSENIGKGQPVMIGRSPVMQHISETIDKVAKTEASILILGENGTGKEVVAREIHRKSNRSGEIFVNVDISALSETLFESELFGHVKGAFTDAKTDRAGRFEIASGGTLFLDEIGNLPIHLQTKLLSAIQNREITRIGSDIPVPVDIRLISATNRSLYTMAEEGSFRQDLLYRINTIQIDLPPLRERIEDIPLLVEYFLKEYSDKYGKGPFEVTKNAYESLMKHPWYGNIRELRHTIEKTVIMSEGAYLRAEDFFTDKRSKTAAPGPGSDNLAENEKYLIIRTLEKYNGNISMTAKKLGINRSTLYEKMKKYEI
ncbi:MAG: sigma-54-dependent Fis family transcriptional regulator [Lentimicrobiaceae bacterium]|nr:sigma-54-dependent Fis family transcriptional regulator [Lentimicrobiaceae bacterium]